MSQTTCVTETDVPQAQSRCTLTDCHYYRAVAIHERYAGQDVGPLPEQCRDGEKYWCLIPGDEPAEDRPITARNRCFNYMPNGSLGWMWPVREDEVPAGTFVRACGTSGMMKGTVGYRQWMEGD